MTPHALNLAGRAAGAPGRRRVLHSRQAALRRGSHGPHHQSHHRHRRRDVPAVDGQLLRAGQGAAGWRRRIFCCSKPARIRATSRPRWWPSSVCGGSWAQRIPIMVSGTIEAMGTMLAGQTADAFCASISHADLLSIGLNCATGPEFMTDHLRTISEMSPVSRFPATPTRACRTKKAVSGNAEVAGAQLERFVDHGWLNMVGGCCGTTDGPHPRHRPDGRGQAAAALPSASHRAYYSGIDLVEAEESNRPLIVGERTNVIGSRLFKKLVAAGKVGRSHRDRAPAGEERRAYRRRVPAEHGSRRDARYPAVLRQADPQDPKRPIMIDTTDPKADRTGADVLPGQEHHQLDQSGGWRREVRARVPARQTLRRRAGGGLHR